NGPDNNRYVYPYLWDVVPQELDMNGSQGNKPLAAVKAQMIAARTYIYQRLTYIDQYGTPNNSTQFHVFLPYRYQALTPPQRVRVQAAALERLYLSEANSTYPLEALYGADNPADTVAGNRPYLQSVPDPISAAYGTVNGTGNGGMSSKGISRWAFGHTSSRGPVAVGQPTYPHDDGGNGDFWPVRWDNAAQLLTHYYTGVHLRNANTPATLLTPTYRWTLLRMVAPAQACTNTAVTVELWVQNTSVLAWPAHTITPVINNLTATPAAMTAPNTNAIPTAVSAGDDVLITRTVRPTFAGTFTYSIDFYTAAVGLFSQQTPPWPRYEQFTLAAVDCQARLYLPMVQSSHVTSVQAQNNQPAATNALDHAHWLPIVAR
ncbi:MAG: hypothetical protein KF686_21620, partial [Ramlibacter sp.]|nr:hypothetical protein [Ramlibacter sp.]